MLECDRPPAVAAAERGRFGWEEGGRAMRASSVHVSDRERHVFKGRSTHYAAFTTDAVMRPVAVASEGFPWQGEPATNATHLWSASGHAGSLRGNGGASDARAGGSVALADCEVQPRDVLAAASAMQRICAGTSARGRPLAHGGGVSTTRAICWKYRTQVNKANDGGTCSSSKQNM